MAQLGLGERTTSCWSSESNGSTRIGELADHLRRRLDGLSGVATADGSGPRSGIVTFAVEGHDADEVSSRAASSGINLSVSRAEDARLDLGVRGLAAVVRASPHAFNTTDELDQLVDLLA